MLCVSVAAFRSYVKDAMLCVSFIVSFVTGDARLLRLFVVLFVTGDARHCVSTITLYEANWLEKNGHCFRVVIIIGSAPLRRVVMDIFTDTHPIIIITDDVVVIPGLPGKTGLYLSRPPCYR